MTSSIQTLRAALAADESALRSRKEAMAADLEVLENHARLVANLATADKMYSDFQKGFSDHFSPAAAESALREFAACAGSISTALPFAQKLAGILVVNQRRDKIVGLCARVILGGPQTALSDFEQKHGEVLSRHGASITFADGRRPLAPINAPVELAAVDESDAPTADA